MRLVHLEHHAEGSWREYIKMQARLAVPRHPHWSEQAWAEYAYSVACGVRDVFHLTETEREQAENLFYRIVVQVRSGTWAGLN